jgi:SAM-dependent methyltransferase
MLPGSLSAGAVLAAFAEPFVDSRRVLVFGSSLSSTPRLLLERGARLVHVCDPAPLRVAEAVERAAAPGLSFSTFADEVLSTREGSFDCVLIENLAAFDARTVVAKTRRLLAPRGVALFATPNREAVAPLLPAPDAAAAPLDYYALYDLVASEFEHVRMLGQAPFVGYAVVEFAPDGAPEPVIDSDFLPRGSEEPELFIAVAARQRPTLAAYTVVQLPFHRVLSGATAERTPARAPAETRGAEIRPLDLERKLARQEAWIAELEARAETADARADQAQESVDELESELETKRGELARAAEELAEVKSALARQSGELERTLSEHQRDHALESAADDRDRRLLESEDRTRELQTRLSERDARLAEREARLVEHDAMLAERDARLVEHDALVAERDARLAERDARLAERDARLAELERSASAETGSDVDALEHKLAERGQELRRLEHELAEAERVGRELLRELAQARGSADPDLTRKLEELSLRLATSEADRLALTWAAAVGRSPGSG